MATLTTRPRFLSSLTMAAVVLSGCAPLDRTASPIGLTVTVLDKEEGEQVLLDYADAASEITKPFRMFRTVNGFTLEEVVVTAARREESFSDVPASEESITNNQEMAVDEGGIVKRYRDFLVVLRKGRLFVVRTGSVLEKVSEAKVQQTEKLYHSWYDELLISGNQLLVLGYSYDLDATELQLFTISAAGELSHQRSYIIRSSDYFSWENYGSRLVDGNLVFMVKDWSVRAARNGTGPESPRRLDSPKVFQLHADGRQTPAWDLLQDHSIVQPVTLSPDPSLTSVVVCPVSAEKLSCRATTVLGDYGLEHYITQDYAYVMQSVSAYGNSWRHLSSSTVKRLMGAANVDSEGAVLYRIPLLTDGAITAVSLKGVPINQFSFDEKADRLDMVVARTALPADITFGEDPDQEHLYALSIPLASFSMALREMEDERYLWIASSDDYFINRFVGDQLLVGQSRCNSLAKGQIYVVDTAIAEKIVLEIDFDPMQIHPIGENALVQAGDFNEVTKKYSSQLLTIDLASAFPQVIDRFETGGEMFSENRSHGFFCRPLTTGGVVAFPMDLYSEAEHDKVVNGHYYQLEPKVVMRYLGVSPGLQLSSLGELEGTDGSWQQDECEVSCYDWYGASRPVFLGDRSFALIKNVLIEGELANGSVVEKQRLDFVGQ